MLKCLLTEWKFMFRESRSNKRNDRALLHASSVRGIETMSQTVSL